MFISAHTTWNCLSNNKMKLNKENGKYLLDRGSYMKCECKRHYLGINAQRTYTHSYITYTLTHVVLSPRPTPKLHHPQYGGMVGIIAASLRFREQSQKVENMNRTEYVKEKLSPRCTKYRSLCQWKQKFYMHRNFLHPSTKWKSIFHSRTTSKITFLLNYTSGKHE